MELDYIGGVMKLDDSKEKHLCETHAFLVWAEAIWFSMFIVDSLF